jgi:hypothetical protein
MQDEMSPYKPAEPGEVLTAEKWNRMQVCIKEDVRATSRAAAEAIERVAEAGNAETLDGRSAAELTEDIARNVLDQVRDRRGYLEVFRVLQVGEESVIEHELGAFPLVDVYQLDYFPVVCCEDKEEYPAWTTFYTCQGADERTQRYAGAGGAKRRLEIQPRDAPRWGVPFLEFMERYKVPFEPDLSLEAMESKVWEAFFQSPNEEFHDNQICHSPWFDKCCREGKTMRDLKRSGDLEGLVVQFRPCRTINYPSSEPPWPVDPAKARPAPPAKARPAPLAKARPAPPAKARPAPDFGWSFLDLASRPVPPPAPSQVQVTQYGWNSVGIKLLNRPALPRAWFDPSNHGLPDFPPITQQFPDIRDELKVMVLLKC